MSKRVIFFLDTAFNQRDYARFGFDIIRARGYAVEAWDFSPVLRPNHYKNYAPPDPIKFCGNTVYTHRRDILHAVSGLSKEDVVICMIGLDQNSAFIFNLLGEKDIPYGFCVLGLLPQANTHRRIKTQLHKFLSSPGTFLGKIFSRLQLKVLTRTQSQHAVSPAFMLIGGEAAKNDRRCTALDVTKIIKAHAFDYDRYLEEEAFVHLNEEAATEGYALFLDEDVPFHPDYLVINANPYCAADRYYNGLNKFFDSFEKATGLPVIVAAHPRADYDKRGNPYGNRKLVFGKTIFYSKYAELVFAHASTSRNFAVLYKKPILFIDSTEYGAPFRHDICTAAAVLGQKLLIVSEDHTFCLQELMTIDDVLYEQYKNSFIKEFGTPNKMNWEIFCDYLDELKIAGRRV